MAELEQLIKALKAADVAGDTQSATVLSQAIRQAQGVSRETVGTPSPPLAGDGPDLNWTDQGYQEAVTPPPNRGGSALLPMSMNEQGEPVFDSDEGILGVMKRAVQLPGQAYRGEFDPASPEAIPRMLEGASVMTPIGAASRVSGSAFVPKSAYQTYKPPAPTREALKEATTAGYGEARALGAEYSPSAVKGWADETISALNAEGRIAENYPKVHRLIEKLTNPPADAKSITLESVDALYKELGRLGADPAEGAVAHIVQKSFDDFHSTLDPSALVAGTASPARAAEILKEARGNAAAGFRSDRVTGLEKTAARRTAAANSGRNTDNAIRQRLTSFIESAKGSRGLSKAEESAIDDIIFGRPTKNAARILGNMLGGGGGLGSSVMAMLAGGGGMATMGPAGAALGVIPPLLGSAARGAANRMTQKELKALDDMLRARSPLGAATGGVQQVYRPGITQDTMLKALLAEGIGGQPVPNQTMQNALGAK